MSKYAPKLTGFNEFRVKLPSEEMGKEFRDYCVQHSLTPSTVIAKVISDYLISRGIVTGQPMPTIEALKRLDERQLT